MGRTLCAVLIAGVCLGLLASAPASAQNLVQLQVVGAETVKPDQVVAWTGLQVDTAVSRETIATAIRKLFETGKFADVFVYEVPVPAGISLIFNVTEYPRLGALRFEGLDKLDEEDIQPEVDLTVGDFVTPAKVRRAKDAIAEKYRAEGYYNVAVELDESAPPVGGRQTLAFRVTEGKKVKVRRIVIAGNEKLTAKELRDGWKTKEDGFLRGGTFKSPEFEADLELLLQHYRDQGYLDAAIVSRDLQFDEKENKLDITVSVSEGPQYRVGDVSWSGNTVFDDARIGSLVALKKDEVFSESLYQLTLQNLRSLYWDEGYIYIVISPKRDRRDLLVDVALSFREGSPARVRQIQIAGNTKTHENVIRREMHIHPGELFVNQDLRDSQRDIFQLGFFNDVKVDFKQAPSPNDIDLEFEVEERQTGQFTMGVGFSQQTQASGFFNIGENNFLGKGQSLQFAWQFGRRRNYLDLSFTEPWFLGTPTLVGAEVFNRFTNRIQDYYDNRTKGFALSVGRPIPGMRYSRASIRYSYNQTTLRNFDPVYVQTLDRLERELGAEGVGFQRLDKIEWPQTTSGLTFSLLRNSTDNPFFPTFGSRATARYVVNGGLLGGDLSYQKILVDYDVYQPLPLKLALHVGTSVGHLGAFAGDDVPDYERFRLGGNRYFSLRGYRDLEVVPRGNPGFVGGRFYTTITSEVLYPVTNSVHLLGFVDQGDTWNSFSEADLTNLRTGAGFGIRLEVPLVGRIGLDYGYGFDQANPGWEAHFNFGTIF